ncbi:MAG: DegV family protein [Coriobacteriia bacterium]|nr:DegV family protein [Coriobacteriia bacterium]
MRYRVTKGLIRVCDDESRGTLMPVRVVTDSTSYIRPEHAEELGITLVSLGVVFGDESFRELDVEDDWFYEKMAATPKIPTSSQPSPGEMRAAFESALKAGEPVVGVFISSEMSGTLGSAELVAADLKSEYSDADIRIVDSRSNSMQLGLAAIAAAKAANAGGDADACVKAAEDTIARTRFLFTPLTLDYLRKGGRIGGASAFLGSLLQIRPILTVEDGQTQAFDKVRTRTRAIERMIEKLSEDIKDAGITDVYVHHINAKELGEHLVSLVQPLVECPVGLAPIGPVIGLHVGPGTVALVYRTRDPLR